MWTDIKPKTNYLVVYGLIILIACLGTASRAATDTAIQFSTNGNGVFNVTNVNEFDWQSSGDIVVVDQLPSPATANGQQVTTYQAWLANAVPGDSVTVAYHFHARLNDMLSPDGGSVLPPDIARNGQLSGCLDGTDCKEITAASSGTLTMQALPSNALSLTGMTGDFKFIIDATPDSTVGDTDTVAPSNFLDGVVFLEGHTSGVSGLLVPDQNGNLTTGSTFITVTIDATDSAYILPDPVSNGTLTNNSFDILLSFPGDGEAHVPVGDPIGLMPYVVQSGDHIRKADANTEFQATVVNLAQLGDRVWEDLDADGIQDCTDGGAGDPNFPADGIIGNAGDAGPECGTGIPGVTVTLLDPGQDGQCNTGDETSLTTTPTDADGFYLFENLDPGQYCVAFDQASANNQLQCDPIIGQATFSPQNQGADDAVDSDADPATGQTGNISLNSGDVDRTWDAGLYCPAKIGDRLTNDANRNGIQDDSEPAGVSGQTVQLFKCVNGVPGNEVIDTTTTDGDGMYMFNPLPPGEYLVEFTAPPGTVFSPKDQGSDDTIDCDADPNGRTQCVTLSPNEYNDTVDACVNIPQTAGLGDFVWEDRDADGIQDGGEPGIPDVPVTLETPGSDGECDTGDEVVVDTTSTDANGMYQFTQLAGGRYCVTFDKSAVQCDFGEAAFSPANQGGDDTVDSDANPTTGRTGNIDLPTGVFDPTWDAGIYCPAKLGDTVWNDLNRDGIQDDVPNTEPGVSDVTVNLFDCQGNPVTDLDGFSSLTTDGDGMYMFRVKPGDYIVEFVKPSDRVFTVQNAPGSTPANDSDADTVSGRTVCITVPSDTFDDTWDAGLAPPPDCGIAVDKTCEVVQAPLPPFTCEGKIDAIVMKLDPQFGDVVNVTAHLGDTNQPTLPVTINGNEVTVSGYQAAGAPNNVVWVYQTTTGSGQSEFHLSCSDSEMDGVTDNAAFPQDCGRPEGDGKDNSSGDNVWLLEGMTSGQGSVLRCTQPASQVATSECEFQQQIASCASLPTKPSTLQLQYTGGGCGTEDNSQDPSKTSCSGAIDPTLPVTVDFPGGTTTVEPGQTFTIPRDGSETTLTLSNAGGTETITFHTSCSQPLETGDVYFSLTLVGLDGLGLGTDVQYSYTVENTGTDPITNISVVDDPLAPAGVPGSPIASLNPGESTTLTATAFISETTENTVTVSGTGVPGAACTATDTATVTVLPPPPCEVSLVFDKLDKDEKIKWKLTNTGQRVATLDTFVLNFPADYGEIKEIKLDGTIYKASESPLVVGPGVTITASDWTEANVSKRQLDPGETRTLEVVFTTKAPGADWSVIVNAGAVTFEEGCSVALIKPAGCEISKPTELVFSYTGAACSATTNSQEGKFTCTESAVPPGLGNLISVTMDKDADKISTDIVGGTMVRIFRSDEIGKEFPSEIKYTITGDTGTQSHVLHTSCSKALNPDDIFGGLMLKEFVPKTN